MSRYIDAELLEAMLEALMARRGIDNWIDRAFTPTDVLNLIDAAPTAKEEG